jgi:hypothetical protein
MNNITTDIVAKLDALLQRVDACRAHLECSNASAKPGTRRKQAPAVPLFDEG